MAVELGMAGRENVPYHGNPLVALGAYRPGKCPGILTCFFVWNDSFILIKLQMYCLVCFYVDVKNLNVSFNVKILIENILLVNSTCIITWVFMWIWLFWLKLKYESYDG